MTYDPQGTAAPGGRGEHPESTKLLVLSIVALLCCSPLAIYTLIVSQKILKEPTDLDTGKINVARILSIVALVIWAVGALISLTTDLGSGLLGS